MADEITEEFLQEATDLLTQLERDLVSVDGGRNPMEVVAQTFRVFHTLKGTSAFLGFDTIRDLGHAAEDLLDAIRGGVVEWTRRTTDLLLESLDAFRALVEEAGQVGPGGPLRFEALAMKLRAAATDGCDTCENKDCTLLNGTACVDPGCGKSEQVLALSKKREFEELSEDLAWEAASRAAPPMASELPPPAAGTPTPVPAPLFQAKGPAPKLVRKVRTPAAGTPAATPTPPPTPTAATPATPAPAAPPKPAPAAHADHQDTGSLRVPVAVLDQLMNLVGELVLARNQLICHPAAREDARLGETSQRID